MKQHPFSSNSVLWQSDIVLINNEFIPHYPQQSSKVIFLLTFKNYVCHLRGKKALKKQSYQRLYELTIAILPLWPIINKKAQAISMRVYRPLHTWTIDISQRFSTSGTVHSCSPVPQTLLSWCCTLYWPCHVCRTHSNQCCLSALPRQGQIIFVNVILYGEVFGPPGILLFSFAKKKNKKQIIIIAM